MALKKRIYLAGCGGMLGEAFYHVFGDNFELKCSDIDENEDWISYLDLRNHSAYLKEVSEFKPNYLFHLGALTNLEYCENHVDDAYNTNTLAVENGVYIANKLKIPFIYISTAGIFDGKKNEYDDWDAPNPLGAYARSKYMGELFVQQHCDTYLVCRAGWMMGGGPKKDKKFIQKIMQQIKDGKKELMVVNDKLGTPTYTHDFANNIKKILEHEYWGIYNLVCEGSTSRLEVAKELLTILNVEDKVKIIPVDSSYFENEYFAPRPKAECLINKKLNLRGLNDMRNWRVCLREYINNYYQGYLN